MSTALAKNVEAYEPEIDPLKIDYASLRSRGWPSWVVESMQELQKPGSHDLSNNLEHHASQPHVAESE